MVITVIHLLWIIDLDMEILVDEDSLSLDKC